MQERNFYIAWLRNALAETGVSQAELGRRVGLNRDQINRLLNGKRPWNEELVADLAKALRINHPESYDAISEAALAAVRMVGVVNPSIWTDSEFIMDGTVIIPSVPDARFIGLEQTAYQVDIDIPGTAISAGTHVITVDIDRARPDGPQDGDLLLCTRENGNLINNTIAVAKRSRSNGGPVELTAPTLNGQAAGLTPKRLIIGLYALMT